MPRECHLSTRSSFALNKISTTVIREFLVSIALADSVDAAFARAMGASQWRPELMRTLLWWHSTLFVLVILRGKGYF